MWKRFRVKPARIWIACFGGVAGTALDALEHLLHLRRGEGQVFDGVGPADDFVAEPVEETPEEYGQVALGPSHFAFGLDGEGDEIMDVPVDEQQILDLHEARQLPQPSRRLLIQYDHETPPANEPINTSILVCLRTPVNEL